MSQKRYYTTQLQAGLGLLEETRQLLQVYQPGMSASQLCEAALASGRFPLVTARRLRNIVAECFAPRYMRPPHVAALLKSLADRFTTVELNQLLFIYTARANLVLADFVREVYWARYSAGRNDLQLEDARTFVANSVREGKTHKPWSETTIKRISSYLLGCCTDYGLLTTTGRNQRSIAAYRILPKVAAYLAYDLKFSGLGDNQIVSSPDWDLFGLERADVRDQLKRLSLQGLLIFQAASDVVHIGWTYKSMEELIDVIAQS
ncbi:Putative inner membrane protein [Pseudomonas guineae]|uniref:Inner membrane protein n=1 Tax=Pseudomonas guineae TaxID=425504 RepID=A0A1I3HAZ8_9PSED|nr:BrxA family protein [Pseudomonas guineae]SFI32884.1 Putative inner membrane protein [Pseudomonas guineae]